MTSSECSDDDGAGDFGGLDKGELVSTGAEGGGGVSAED